MDERRGIDVQTSYGLIRAICLKYFGKAAAQASIEADDLVNQVAMAIEVRNRGKCPYKPKAGHGPKPYIYRVAWQTLGRMARKRRRWYNLALCDDHGMLCQIAAAQGFAELDSPHPLGKLADEAQAERRLMAATKRKAKQRNLEAGPRFDLFDPWAMKALAHTVAGVAKRDGERAYLREGASIATYEARLCSSLNAYQRGEWAADDGSENLAHVMAAAMAIIGMRHKMEQGK